MFGALIVDSPGSTEHGLTKEKHVLYTFQNIYAYATYEKCGKYQPF